MGNETRNRTYNIEQTATILGISTARAARDVRLGTIRSETRRGRIVVTEREIVRLLDGAQEVESESDSHSPAEVANVVDRYRNVPTDALVGIVRHGCAEPLADDAPPNGSTDADLAAQTCASCRAPYACLALEFRVDGHVTVGVWGGLAEDERRALFAAWAVAPTSAEIEGEWA